MTRPLRHTLPHAAKRLIWACIAHYAVPATHAAARCVRMRNCGILRVITGYRQPAAPGMRLC